MNKIIQLYEKIPSDTPLFIINNNYGNQHLTFLLTETADYEIFEKNKKLLQLEKDVTDNEKNKEKENILEILLFITLLETYKANSSEDDYSCMSLFDSSANSFINLSFKTIKNIFHESIFPKILTKQCLRKTGKSISSTDFASFSTSDKNQDLYNFIINIMKFMVERQDETVFENDTANNQFFCFTVKDYSSTSASSFDLFSSMPAFSSASSTKVDKSDSFFDIDIINPLSSLISPAADGKKRDAKLRYSIDSERKSAAHRVSGRPSNAFEKWKHKVELNQSFAEEKENLQSQEEAGRSVHGTDEIIDGIKKIEM
jgi:hypothetical protein